LCGGERDMFKKRIGYWIKSILKVVFYFFISVLFTFTVVKLYQWGLKRELINVPDWDGIKAIVAMTSVVIAAITYVSNSDFNRKKLEAETVSKARIEWIQVTRKAAAKFIAAAKHKGENSEFKKLGALLKMYFGPSEGTRLNDCIVWLIDKILKKPSQKKIDILSDVLRCYFKNEWKRSINSISEAELKIMENELIEEYFVVNEKIQLKQVGI
jgi:glutamate formiminotransferase